MTAELAARLKAADISVMTEGMYFSIFFREGCLATVPVLPGGLGYAGIGSSGLSTDDGLMYLVWRDEHPLLVGYGREVDALPEQVEQVTRFSADLKQALGLE